MGKTIIDGFNNLFTFVNNYFNTADFINFGSKLGIMVNKGLKAINPKEWGQALVNKLNAAWQTAYGFVSTLNWSLLGTRFQEIIRNAFDSIDINSIADTISTTLNGIKTVILGWADTFPIVEMGKKIWSVIDRSLTAVDWKGLGQSLNKLITQLFQALRNIDYGKITKSIADFLDGLNLIGLFKDYVLTKAQLIGEGLVGLFSTPSGAALGLVGIISILGKTISNLSNGPLGALNTQLFLASSNFMNLGIHTPKSIKNIAESINHLKVTMGEAGIVDFFRDSLKNDVLPKLSSMVNNLGNSFKLLLNPVEALKVAFNTLQGAAQSLWQLLLANPMAIIVAAITALVGSFIYAYQHSEVLRDNISKIWEQFKNFCGFIIDQVKIVWDSWLKPLFDNLKQTISNLMNKVITPLWELISSVVSKIITLLNTILKPVLGVLLQWFNTVFFGSISKGISSILTTINSAIDVVSGLIDSAKLILQGFSDFFVGVFTGDWYRAWDGCKYVVLGTWTAIIGIIKGAINSCIGFINGWITAIQGAVSSIVRGINSIYLNVKIPDWIPVIGGKKYSLGFNLQVPQIPKIPYLEDGGVLSSETMAILAEYPGAYKNPEIVTPQNILRDTVVSANNELVSAFAQFTRQIIQSIEGVDMNISIGDDVIASSASRGDKAYKKRTGKSLFAY